MSNRLRTVVFPVAGLGTRFLPATKVIPKEMLRVGDRIERGSVIATVETDKAIMDVEVFREGYLSGPTAPLGAVVLTSRVSTDMVQKVAMLGAPMIIAVSAPTVAAVELAEASGITLVALAKGDRFEVFSHTDRLKTEEAHVG